MNHLNANLQEEGFHITSENTALWYLRKLANLEAEQSRVKRQAESLLCSLQSEAEGLKRLYQGELEQWAREELARKGSHRRTLHTLQGTLRFRHVPARLALVDPDAALRLCEREGLECIETRREVNRENFLRYAQAQLDTTGELIAGATLLPERESFSVSFGKEEEN